MKETPLLLCGEMVRAELAGRKWMTRRLQGLDVFNADPDGWQNQQVCKVMKGLPKNKRDRLGVMMQATEDRWSAGGQWHEFVVCPYGGPGDVLWMRETFCFDPLPKNGVIYKVGWPLTTPAQGWKPSIFMPRWACRIVRELVAVRVERVHDISAEDCIAEGLSTTLREHDAVVDLRRQYQELWDRLNAKRGFPWKNNPWVWVLEWKRENTDGH